MGITVLMKNQTFHLRKRGNDKERTLNAAYHGNTALTPPNVSMNYDLLPLVYGLLFSFSFLSMF